MSVLRPIWLNLAILAAFGLQADAVFGQVFNGLQRQGGVARSANGPHHFTIMGHIARPNCYEALITTPLLVDVVKLAGGLTPTAGGPIRIVRDGRTVQSTFYQPDSLERLAPGDIVVVDGKLNQGRIIHRGSQGRTSTEAADVTLAITGIRDYPVVKTIPADRATIRWVTRHLGLDPGVINFVKAITQRQSVRVLPDSRLATGTVLAFDPAMVDPSRLPDNLPVPVKAGRQAATPQQTMRPAGPVVQQPLTGPFDNRGNQYGASPGRARVPTIESRPQSSTGQTENLDLTPGEQTFVKQLLTDPASVPLDEPTPELSGRAFVPQQPVAGSPAIDAGAANNFQHSPAASASGGSAIVGDAARRPEQAAPNYAHPLATESALAQPANQPRPEMADFSPDAPRPYQSEPATPEPLQPFGSSRSALEHSPRQFDPPRQLDPSVDASPPPAVTDSGRGGGFNLAMQGATLAATAAATSSNRSNAEDGRGTPPPSPPASSAGGPTAVSPNSPSPISPVLPGQPFYPSPAQSYPSPTQTEAIASAPASFTATGSTDGSRLLPPPPSNLNWPVISILTVGFLGAVAACFLIYSIAHENPAPRSAQIDTSGRYWLDRMIENDIPIEDEEVNYPHKTQLFGKPAPLQRVDAAHQSVPRPHFSAPGGKSGVLKENPAMPDAPSPEISDNNDTRIVRVHSGGPLRKQGAAAVPMPHSVETAAKRRDAASGLSAFAATAVFGDTAQQADRSSGTVDTTDTTATETSAAEPSVASAKKPGRQFRLDTGHKADEKVARTASRPAGGRKPVTVQPSPVVVKGANLLDRILSSVEHEQTVARPKADASGRSKRQSDERGQS